MLVRLFGTNFRAFQSPFELSMVAADLTGVEDRGRGVVEVSVVGLAKPLNLLRAAAIFGPNASGKSTVLAAGRALNWLVTASSRSAAPDEKIFWHQPFLLDLPSKDGPVSLGCDVVCHGRLVRYEIEYGASSITKEVLSILDDKGETKLIDRGISEPIRGKLIERSKANKLYVEEMQPNVAVLSKLAQHGPKKGLSSVVPYYEAIRDATRFADYSNRAFGIPGVALPHSGRFADDPAYRDWIMEHLIRAADVGITEVRTSREKLEYPDEFRTFAKAVGAPDLPESQVVFSFVHEGASSQSIAFHFESSGTQKLFNIAGDWWNLANKPATLLADELSASLHPRLLDRLVRAVNEPPSTLVRSQLIFSTHDVGLLEGQDGLPPALRRDQVYFTEKGADGAATLFALAEFKDDARSVHNLRKRYMSGRYGAIPIVKKVSL